MFKLLYKSKSRSTPDFAQMLILCAIALLIGLAVPARGGLVIIVQIFVDTFHDPVSNIVYILIPIIAILLVFGRFAAFHSRNRWWGLLIFFGSAYIFWFADQYLRNRVWSEPPQIGAAILFASTLFSFSDRYHLFDQAGEETIAHILVTTGTPCESAYSRVCSLVYRRHHLCAK
ncbi:MAG: hypothetical protein MI924_35870 [Chloroflexales bacterium]|nr:hypothetical protein [Chloroflexales bacterium]